MKFFGELEEIKEKLSSICEEDKWYQLNANQIQYKSEGGAVLNWYPSTGTISFQGRNFEELKRLVEMLLSGAGAGAGADEVEEDGKVSSEALCESLNEDQQGQLSDIYPGSELVLGLVGAVGTNLDQVVEVIKERLEAFQYSAVEIKISKDIISPIRNVKRCSDNYQRIDNLMTQGNKLRELTEDNSVLALAAAAKVNEIRTAESSNDDGSLSPVKNKAFLINSLKHPEEVQRLRKIYSNGFFLVGVYADEKRRLKFLTDNKRIAQSQAQDLMERDSDESEAYGQHTRDTFHLSDFFVNFDGDNDRFQNEMWRVIDLIFGKPYVTPTFDEFAMFMAFSSSLRSGDLSRQVGAVISKDNNIISTGANDVPKFGGGLYWPEYDPEEKSVVDEEDGRDFKRGYDSNSVEKQAIIDDILERVPEEYRSDIESCLRSSRIKDITEYGRVVHAEMEAILACARSSVNASGATMYCTTFPCHNCAKHIVASGIERVVYVEPYPKSKAVEFHSDSISLQASGDGASVLFEPFVGVGPRSFFNHFSTSLGSGYPIKRKRDDGQAVEWSESDAVLRMQMLPTSYIERETMAASMLGKYLEDIDED